MNRRTLIRGAAWSVPVIATMTTTPVVAASATVCGGPWDNGTYTVTGTLLVIQYRTAPDIYEVNARGNDWAASYGTNYGTAPEPGSLTWVIHLPGRPVWVQCHSINEHLGETC